MKDDITGYKVSNLTILYMYHDRSMSVEDIAEKLKIKPDYVRGILKLNVNERILGAEA